MCGRRKQKQKLKTFKYARRNINPYSKVHRSLEQKDYKLNHINNSCSVWNATYFHKVCAFSINGYIDI